MNEIRTEPLLTAKNLKKIFRNGSEFLEILKNIDIEISEGETVMITGESGSGKSTFLNLVAGLDTPSDGHIISCGYEVNNLGENELSVYRSKKIGLIFQFHYLLKDFTALENVFLPAYMTGVKKSTAEKKAQELLETVKMDHRLNHYPSQLSGGERQRVAVARALINDPHLVLADEPTGNLDESNSRVVEDLLLSVVKEFGKTMILVSHDKILAERGSRSLLLEGGEIREK